jgi:hypothetical protein
MSGLTVATFNIGSSWQDYANTLAGIKCNQTDVIAEAFPKLLDSVNAEAQANYAEAEKQTSEKLCGLHYDAICLQEVTRTDRPIMTALKANKYVVLHWGTDNNGQVTNEEEVKKGFDCAIALSTERYNDIDNHSARIKYSYVRHLKKGPKKEDDERDVAIVIAFDNTLKEYVLFVSAMYQALMLIILM